MQKNVVSDNIKQVLHRLCVLCMHEPDCGLLRAIEIHQLATFLKVNGQIMFSVNVESMHSLETI